MATNLHRRRADAGRRTGFGLVEVVLAIALTSIGVLVVAGVALGIGEQARMNGWAGDHALAARSALEATMRAGYAAAVSGSGVVSLGARRYPIARTVSSTSPRLKHVRLSVSAPPGRIPVSFDVRLAQSRPLPAAP